MLNILRELLEVLSKENIFKSEKGKNKNMNREDLIKIAESFVQWLKDTSAEYSLSESDLQAIIKQFLIG